MTLSSPRSSARTNADPDRAMNDGLIVVSAICCAVGVDRREVGGPERVSGRFVEDEVAGGAGQNRRGDRRAQRRPRRRASATRA